MNLITFSEVCKQFADEEGKIYWAHYHNFLHLYILHISLSYFVSGVNWSWFTDASGAIQKTAELWILHLNDCFRVANLSTVSDSQRIISQLQVELFEIDLNNLRREQNHWISVRSLCNGTPLESMKHLDRRDFSICSLLRRTSSVHFTPS